MVKVEIKVLQIARTKFVSQNLRDPWPRFSFGSVRVPRPKTEPKNLSSESLPIPQTETEPSLKKHYSQTLITDPNTLSALYLTPKSKPRKQINFRKQIVGVKIIS